LRRIGQYDLVVVLHSATGDDLSLLLKTSRFYTARRGKLLVLVGNEYNHLALKRRFINETQADYIGSQLPLPAAQWLYADCAASAVVEAPHALNPKEYHPLPAVAREFDIGFVGDIYSYAIGDIERTRIIEFFRDRGREFQLNCRIQNQRMPASQWNLFLNRCQGIIGAESGTYYLEKDDRTMTAVREYLLRHPDATFAEVYERFYRNYPCPVNGKAISSRHFEPIGTKTCQILLAGEYNGILQPERHYIAVRKDLADIADAIERFKDENYRRRIVEQSYEDVLNHHTYRHRIDSILDRIFNGSGDVYR
jgi:spore maturation protein CgeB